VAIYKWTLAGFRQIIQMVCETVFTRCVYVATTTATGSLLSALIQIANRCQTAVNQFVINIRGSVITITILKLQYLKTTTTIIKNDVLVN